MSLSWTPPSRNVHPRLCFDQSQLGQAQIDALGPKKGESDKIQSWVNRALSMNVDAFHTQTPEDTSALAFYYLLTGSVTAANKAISIAQHLATRAFDDNNTETVNDMIAIAHVYDWLWGYMSASQRTSLRTAMAARADAVEHKTRIEEAFGWGHSPDNTLSRAILLWSIMEDGTTSENSAWRSKFSICLDYIDTGTQDSFFGVCRHFSGVGEAIPPWGIMSYGDQTYMRYWARFIAALRNTSLSASWSAQNWFRYAIDTWLWHWRGDDSFHRTHESGLIARYPRGVNLHALLTAYYYPSAQEGRRATWLRERMAIVRDYALSDSEQLYVILFKNTSVQPLKPTNLNMGAPSQSGFRVFPTLARVCVRETGGPQNRDGWNPDDISVVFHIERFRSGTHQQNCLGNFTVAADAPVMSRIGGRAGNTTSYKRDDNTGTGTTGHKHSFNRRILGGNMVSVIDADEEWKTDPVQVAFWQSGEASSVLGIVDAAGTFTGKNGDKVKFIDCGDHRWPADLSKSSTKYNPHNVTELINRWDLWGFIGASESSSPFDIAPVVGSDFYYFGFDMVRAYPGWLSGATRAVKRRVYFIRPGAIPGWDRLSWFIWDRVDSDNHTTFGKLTKRLFFVNPEAGQSLGGNVWRLNNRNSSPALSLFLYLLLPASLETVTRTKYRDTDGNEYQAASHGAADENRGTDGWRLEVNPPGTGAVVDFLTFFAPCAGGVASANRPPVSAILTGTEIGVRVGWPTDEIDFTVPLNEDPPSPPPPPADTTPPADPTGLSATGGTGQVSLSWNANSESDMNTYRLERRQRSV